ncbi:MAG TPA: alpha/beta hydrolase [Acidimicrobiales bacterium]|nr:alpha/beta hydrolase [Acidimicrobiales bacterium]
MIGRIDPELRAALEGRDPRSGVDWDDLPGYRARAAAAITSSRPPGAHRDDVGRHDLSFAGVDGRAVPARLYRPEQADGGPLPALLWFHGGGFVSGGLERDDLFLEQLCAEVGCAAVAVDYRLAPEWPFPAALDDCVEAFDFVAGQAAELGVDPSRIAVGGRSAGGGLAAACSLRRRDLGRPRAAFQLLLYPMLDDRLDTASSHEIVDPRTWDRASSTRAWSAYLGEAGDGEKSAYGAPGRAEDLAGLPPTYLAVGELEVVRDEAVAFGHRLLLAGVATELHVFPGAYHGWDLYAPAATSSKRLIDEAFLALRRAFGGS